MNQNAVVFKGRKNGITIMLDTDTAFDEIRQALEEKLDDANKFFGGAKTAITFQGRILTEDEQTQLLEIIAGKANLSISFVSEDVYMTSEAGEQKQSSDPSTRLFLPEHVTKFHGGSLRSGQAIRFSGSVVILGDVNPGAEVIADGNIIVLGAAKGLVHAGCTGNLECFVSAVSLTPVQLRIADIITCIPTDMAKSAKKSLGPSYAYVKDGQIYIAPLQNV